MTTDPMKMDINDLRKIVAAGVQYSGVHGHYDADDVNSYKFACKALELRTRDMVSVESIEKAINDRDALRARVAELEDVCRYGSTEASKAFKITEAP